MSLGMGGFHKRPGWPEQLPAFIPASREFAREFVPFTLPA